MDNGFARVRGGRGFTLVELLVVVAIIVILVAVLMPVVDRAREQAKMITCASSMRVIGQAVQTFANQNGGRGPGIANDANGSVSWVNILDSEVFGRPGNSYGMVRMASNQQDVQAGIVSNVHTLNCPNFVARTDYRPYAMNYDMATPPTITNGKATYSANELVQNPLAHGANYTEYHLGAMMTRFYPTEVLLVEHDDSSDTAPQGPGPVVLNRDASPPKNPGYVANGGALSFRHPYYERANFLLFDGSIQAWRPTDKVLNVDLYAIH